MRQYWAFVEWSVSMRRSHRYASGAQALIGPGVGPPSLPPLRYSRKHSDPLTDLPPHSGVARRLEAESRAAVRSQHLVRPNADTRLLVRLHTERMRGGRLTSCGPWA